MTKDEKAAYDRKRYAANPEKYLAYSQAYGMLHRENAVARMRRYRIAHPAAAAMASRKFHDAHPERSRFWRERSGRWLAALKANPCMDCGGRFSVECMDFDHVREEKVRSVGSMRTASIEVFAAEIEKCELVCANCHRTRTAFRREERKYAGYCN